MPEISIVLPIYNEEQGLERLFLELENCGLAAGRFEVIAVDDGSTDRSAEILFRLQKEKTYLKVISFRRNSGQSAAFDAGFRHASGDYIVTMDADLQNDPKDIPKLLAKLKEGYDFATGWRKSRQDTFVTRKIPSKIANFLIRKITKTKIHDLGCSLKAYKKEIVQDLRLYGEMHRFISVLVEILGAKIAEVEVNHRARSFGSSKYGLSRTVKVLLDLITVWFFRGYQTKPIYVFGGIGAFSIAVSGMIFGFVLYEKLALEIWVHKNPLFMLASLLLIVGVQFMGLGLLAELVIRTYYESQGKPAYFIGKKAGF